MSKSVSSADSCSAKSEFQVGEKAPLAHQDVRKFPAWYKPYGFNYTSDGYMLLVFGVFGIFGYSYINDICEQKGRRSRKVFESSLPTQAEKVARQRSHAQRRLDAHDPYFLKFTEPKERAALHH